MILTSSSAAISKPIITKSILKCVCYTGAVKTLSLDADCFFNKWIVWSVR